MEKEKIVVAVLLVAILIIGGGIYWFNTNKTVSDLGGQNTTLTNEASSDVGNGSYTMDEVAVHNSASDCWLVINNNVYNVTTFIPKHPGGRDIIKGCGKDATNMFNRESEHQEKNASQYLPDYLIGTLSK
jgi:cytochrome b involved in lipid metabolism